MYYGRNFDWNVGIGAVMVNQRGVKKTAFVLPPERPLSWVATYGSVTFNQFSKEIPVGGMNEKGLVVESLVSTAQHPAKDDRPAVNELQWIQYHLDTCKNVEEVLRSAESIRISSYAVHLHYFVTDAQGNSAVIEWIGGELVPHTGRDLPIPVLANTSYDQALQSLGSSRDRFARASELIQKYRDHEDAREYTFKVLDAVAQGRYTKWQVFYDISQLRITFRTSKNRKERWIDFADVNFAASSSPRMLDVNAKGKGDQKDNFQLYTRQANDELIRKCRVAFEKTGIARHMTAEHVQRIRQLLYTSTE